VSGAFPANESSDLAGFAPNKETCASGRHFSRRRNNLFSVMGANTPPATMREILDRLDVVREELHSLQSALEKLASYEATAGSNVAPDGSDVGP
jgi:hypothetical protein